ncbi:MAG: peptidoglycan-binding protein [Micavibrio aeruginosavorus]|uniref:Peptidoglycan-binding protein n=1 Tax=Micavibrio aeruginosavorus TaxID=349221 RepID=A0A2W5A3C7_9BACT|nr:MAG: peptidoglycan-binding protein [Micavibrio aeruginosavorus]
MSAKRNHSFLLAALLLSGCWTPTGRQAPVNVVNYGTHGGAGTTGMHTVRSGDTVYTVSQRYNLPLREIISLNSLSAPYRLSSGLRLKLPPPREYRVQPGDTLNGLSRTFNVSVSEMASLNNVPSPYVIKRGQVLRLPTPQPALEADLSQKASSSVNLPDRVAPSGYDETTAPAVKVASVEREVLSAPQDASKQEPEKVIPAAGLPAAGFPPQPAAKPASGVLQPPAAKVEKVSVPPSVAPKIPARAAAGRFMRPVEGKVISGYGPKADGLHNDGINIKAARGTAVRSAENGVVAYVGNEMTGYGNLVLVRHADGWMTAYAHMDKTLVTKGQTVKAGQSIGTVGSTGGVDSPQLHFEVRKGTKAVDPASYI